MEKIRKYFQPHLEGIDEKEAGRIKEAYDVLIISYITLLLMTGKKKDSMVILKQGEEISAYLNITNTMMKIELMKVNMVTTKQKHILKL